MMRKFDRSANSQHIFSPTKENSLIAASSPTQRILAKKHITPSKVSGPGLKRLADSGNLLDLSNSQHTVEQGRSAPINTRNQDSKEHLWTVPNYIPFRSRACNCSKESKLCSHTMEKNATPATPDPVMKSTASSRARSASKASTRSSTKPVAIKTQKTLRPTTTKAAAAKAASSAVPAATGTENVVKRARKSPASTPTKQKSAESTATATDSGNTQAGVELEKKTAPVPAAEAKPVAVAAESAEPKKATTPKSKASSTSRVKKNVEAAEVKAKTTPTTRSSKSPKPEDDKVAIAEKPKAKQSKASEINISEAAAANDDGTEFQIDWSLTNKSKGTPKTKASGELVDKRERRASKIRQPDVGKEPVEKPESPAVPLDESKATKKRKQSTDSTESESHKAQKAKDSKAKSTSEETTEDAAKPEENPRSPRRIKEGTLVYVGHIPHGFYEQQMYSFFSQFGKVLRHRVIRNAKTGKSRGFAFVEFADTEVAAWVANEFNDYFLMDKTLKCAVVASENIDQFVFKRGLKPAKDETKSTGFSKTLTTDSVKKLKVKRNRLAKRARRVDEELAKYGIKL